MGAKCEQCGKPLGLTRRVLGHDLCETCEAEQAARAEAERAQAVRRAQAAADAYRSELAVLKAGVATIVESWQRLDSLQAPPELDPSDALAIREEAFEALSQRLEGPDGRIDLWAGEFLDGVFRLLDLPQSMDFAASRRHILRLARSDMLTALPWPAHVTFIRFEGEELLWGSAATLLKLVEDRELRLDIAGAEHRLTERTGGFAGKATGREVAIGRRLDPVGSGMTYVTSVRLVFISQAASFDVRWPDLLSIDAGGDELLIRTSSGDQYPLMCTQADLLAECARASVRRSRGAKPRDGSYPELPPLSPSKERLIAALLRRRNWTPETANFFRLRDVIGQLDWSQVERDAGELPN